MDWQSQPQTAVWSRIMSNLNELRRIVGKGQNNYDLRELVGHAHDSMSAQSEKVWRRAVERQVKSAAPTLGYARKLVATLDEDIARYATQKRTLSHEAQTGEPPPEHYH